MPRNHNLGTSTLRNRNRVTNKTRLRIVHGTIDADPVVLDEDEEKARIVSTAGVDAEDANEHHLQAVLSAASQRHQAARATRGASEKTAIAPPAYIPTPDSTGTVDNYSDLYPSQRWKDPAAYIKSSETVDEAIAFALADGFTYYMDEYDEEWLERNNEEARGEGTSAQGSITSPAATTRSGSLQRSAKAKGKEPDIAQPIAMTEDEFELVMAVFERVTHEKTEYLHHGLEQGMAFPPFSDYQDSFASPLPPSIFATFTIPPWVAELYTDSRLLRLANVIYPHWRERRTDRGGRRIIPSLNFDETDVTNESYICFRRREIKAVRKTRASQATSSDKLLRLQSELTLSLELANKVLLREKLKKDCYQQAVQVWEKRVQFADLKRKSASLGTKEDEELLHDKESAPKKPRVDTNSRFGGLKLQPRTSGDVGSLASQSEATIRPKERWAMISAAVERDVARQKEKDHHWEDALENPYQPPLVPYHRRQWRPIPSTSASASRSSLHDEDVDEGEEVDDLSRRVRFLRIRQSRLRRAFLDRWDSFVGQHAVHDDQDDSLSRRKNLFLKHLKQLDGSDNEDEEETSRISSQWKFDEDDYPMADPEGPDEQDRILVDDFHPKYLRHGMTLLQDQDFQNLMNDPTIVVANADGRPQSVVPFRLGLPPPIPRRDAQGITRMYASGAPVTALSGRPASALPVTSAMPNGVPALQAQAHAKSMQPPPSVPHLRISSNGGMRIPGAPASGLPNNMPPHASPPHQPVAATSTAVTGANNMSAPALENEPVKLTVPMNSVAMTNHTQNSSESNAVSVADGTQPVQVVSPLRPKSDNQHSAVAIPNGYHLAAMNGYPMHNGSPYLHPNRQHNGLSLQQMQNLKVAFANGQDVSGMHSSPGRTLSDAYGGHVAGNTQFNMAVGMGTNINLKLPPSRQWPPMAANMQQVSVAGVGVDSGAVSSGASLLHPVHGNLPSRTPSANGSRMGIRPAGIAIPHTANHLLAPGQLASHSLSPHLQHSPSPLGQPMGHASPQLSPPRLPQTPTMKMASPSLQHQQIIGNPQGGY